MFFKRKTVEREIDVQSIVEKKIQDLDERNLQQEVEQRIKRVKQTLQIIQNERGTV
jgi:hypothetical protein